MSSKDTRTKRQKLRDMANQSESPHEAEIARAKLNELKEESIRFKNGDSFTFNYTVSYTASGISVTHDFKLGDEDGVWVFDSNGWNRF